MHKPPLRLSCFHENAAKQKPARCIHQCGVDARRSFPLDALQFRPRNIGDVRSIHVGRALMRDCDRLPRNFAKLLFRTLMQHGLIPMYITLRPIFDLLFIELVFITFVDLYFDKQLRYYFR